MLNRIILGTFTLILLLASGCATTKTSGFLSGSEQLHKGQFLENYWADAGLKPQTLTKILVEDIDISRITDQPPVTRAEASQWLKTAIVSSIQAQPGWQTGVSGESPTAKLSLAITFLTPGSANGRIIAGEFGLGHAIVQVDGKLVDASSGKEVAAFSVRRRDSGSIGFEDALGDVSPRLVKRMLDKIASDVVKELSASPN